MSVAELIEQLKQYPPDLPVFFSIVDRAGITWCAPCNKVEQAFKKIDIENVVNPVMSITIYAKE